MIKPAQRLHNTQEYYFSKKLREVRALMAAGNPIINLGIGSPDLEPPSEVIKALNESLVHEGAHQYQPYKGIPELRQTMAGFYKNHYDVLLDPDTQVLPLTGSKEGVMHISLALLNKGDKVLVPNPGYPSYGAVAELVEAIPIFYALDEAHDWMPDLDALSNQDLSDVKLMWVNYPHMPTGANPKGALFETLIAFAKKHSIVLVNDNPYSFILNDTPNSLLSYAHKEDPCLELNSLSKTFNMAGWRVGIVAGNPELVQHVLTVKSNMDSGMFYGLQKGAIAALNSDIAWMHNLNKVYEERRLWAWKIADALGCSFHKDAAGLFVWAKLPEGKEASEVSDRLLHEHHVFITPGFIFGTQGEGYIRISLCVDQSALKTAYERITTN
ncbi:MAG: aminotransferase class I/II-fold pyridoxal phosphate-dependent enzyme [Gilvibacter sp.]